MKLHVGPVVGLCNDKIIINISGLPPLGKVKISASLCLPWAKKTKFESYAWFTADSEGNVDLSKQKPDSGTYDFIDSMGLIVSMKMVTGKIKDIVENISPDNSLFIEIVAECEKYSVRKKVERLFKNHDVKTEKVADGFVGELFYTENSSNKTIVVLGGSDGNTAALSLISAQLASHGFNALSVAYFNSKELPKKLAEIPLDYFDRVFQWLNKNPITSGNDVYVHGTSKGGELALLLASRNPIIKKVVAFAPHAYCFQGLNYKNVSSWTYGGKPLPFIRLKYKILFLNMLDCLIKNTPFGYAYTYKTGVDTATNKEAARIKIENANANILLFAGENDNIWNAYDGCVEIMDTLSKHNYKYNYNFFAYKDSGHPFPSPYIIPLSVTLSMKLAPRLVFVTGGTIEGNAKAQVDSWSKTIEFFKNCLPL
ncbi:acyl-CoA thioesterase/bile acid-CoA:amino acid N-acyltransferase family protein [Pseudobacteroides cellulosolvens]|uniref:Palmitoyl-CoA hydrolase n=1 Tax=Pseudobacteroides cellulosolvens ATCC 35603 = DSM 2933 TaxID=398512 RepID=A0A0L6JUG6_9FIRM|nr:acyl-CoA thioester hydrolase/BAAT C-terminal domain-containing protein [Pseudobacteroides cellulosolvens]KNY29290.1 Palmitoyl-CoA hydrolase [Pseudobacteroides cellulosolvens ATCC 35603 = DSM 2933]